jgi:hypothetical protein
MSVKNQEIRTFGKAVALGFAITVAIALSPAHASAQAGSSMESCQKTIGKDTSKYLRSLSDTVGKCLQRASSAVLANGGSAGDAAKYCIG